MLSVGDCIAVFVLVHVGNEFLNSLLVEPAAKTGNQFLHVVFLIVGTVAQDDVWQFSCIAITHQCLPADPQTVHQFLCAVHTFSSQEKQSFVVSQFQVVHQYLNHLFLSLHLLDDTSHTVKEKVFVKRLVLLYLFCLVYLFHIDQSMKFPKMFLFSSIHSLRIAASIFLLSGRMVTCANFSMSDRR